MKRILRNTLLILGSLVVLSVAVLVAIPLFFEDDLKDLLRRELNKQLLAKVEFADLNLSLLRGFPNASISLLNYSVANIGDFEGDTLVRGDRVNVVVNLMSIFRGKNYEVKSVSLENTRVDVHVLPDGRANYDIMLPDSVEVPADTLPAATFQLALNRYRLSDTELLYRDESLPFMAHAVGLNHEGSGNFSAEDFLLKTNTTAEKLFVTFDGVAYLEGLPLEAKVDLDIHTGEVFSVNLRDNEFRLNRFPLALAGTVAMPGEDINMDLAFSSPSSDFGTLLSLLPTVFKSEMAGLKTSGSLQFDGALKGTYNENSFPGYSLNLGVQDGFIQYPDLPESIRDIGIDLSVNNPDGEDPSLLIDLKRFEAFLGNNPITATLRLENLLRPSMVGNAKASLNLAELASIYPIEGTTLGGRFSLDADVNGQYDEQAGTFPRVAATMGLVDGLIQSKEYNTTLSDFALEGSLNDVDGSLQSAVLDISRFHFLLDGVPLDGTLKVQDFDDPLYALSAKGDLDLGKMFQLYPIDSMELTGKLSVNDLYAAGRYSDVEAERYDQLNNRGSVTIQSLFYRDLWYTQPGITLESGLAQFTPQRLSFQDLRGKLGQSTFSGSGYLTNYLAYLLMGSEELQGDIQMSSPSLNLNEWLAEEEMASTGTAPTEEVPLEVYPIPAGYDLVMNLDLAEVIYDDLTLQRVKGMAEIKDQQLFLENVSFGMLGANVVMGGAYDTRNSKRAGYDFFLDIKDLGVKEAFQYFSVVQGFAPVAKAMEGKCNLEVGLKGGLNPDFSPILENLDAFGLFELLSGGLSGTPLTSAIASKTNISALSSWDLKDIKGVFRIEDGKLHFDPIDIKLGDVVLNLGGAQSLQGDIRYTLGIDAPSGSLGQAAFQSLSSLTGTTINPGERVQVNLLVTGTGKDPKISASGGGTASVLEDQAKQALENRLNDQLGTDISLNRDSLRVQADQMRQRTEDSLRAVALQAKQQVQDSLKSLADSARVEAQRALEEELKNQVGDEVNDKLKDLKDKIKLPKRKP